MPLEQILQVGVVTDSSNQRGGNLTCQRRTPVAAEIRAMSRMFAPRAARTRLGKRF
jgi:hypothetical protein